MKAKTAAEVCTFQDIPNVGPEIEKDFLVLGFHTPQDLMHKDPYALYKKLCNVTGKRHDPCVLDTFIAVTDFLGGATARPWFFYTNMRKKKYPNL